MEVLIPLLAAVIGAVTGWGVAVANYRQAWINSLREDLGNFLKEVSVVHDRYSDVLSGAADSLEKLRDARSAALLARWRVILRLNPFDPVHQDLEAKIEALMVVKDAAPKDVDVSAIVELARLILRTEWARAQGPLAWFKSRRRYPRGTPAWRIAWHNQSRRLLDFLQKEN
jgi:hypothetical protein